MGLRWECSSFWRLTLRIIPSAIAVKRVEEPPREISGRVCLLGGTVCPETGTVRGISTLSQLERYHLDAAYLSATAISETGVMDDTEEDGLIAAAMLRQADQAVVLAESEKLGKQSYYRVSTFDEIATLITDDEHPMSETVRHALADAGVTCHIVHLGEAL